MTGFEDLDDDVLHLILDYLSFERASILESLRCTSRRLKYFADTVAYKTLSLIDDEAHEQITYHLAERLTDTSDRLCRYVRDLCIVNFKGDARSSCLNTRLIEDCLRHIQRLDSFTWDGTYPIPIEILDVLQQRFPRATVCAKVALSQPSLLEISQLSRLDVSIPLADAFADRSMSLFQALKQAVFQLPNLRHLSIDTHFETGIENIEGAAYSRPQIPLELGDQLPPLESLQIRSISYAFDLEHCQLLLASMDCNKLRSLILGSPNPVNFFEVFVGRLCQLTELDISYASNRDDPRHLRLEACSKLLAGLDSLQKLSFRFDKLDLRSNFAQTLQEVHGPRLLSLSLQPGHIDTAGQELCGNVRRFLHKFVRLQLLDMAFADVASYHRCSDCQGYDYSIHDPIRFSFIPPLPSIKRMNLSVRSSYSEKDLIAHINKHAHCAICNLWSGFVARPKSQAESLSIRFWRWESGRKTQLKEVVYDSTRSNEQVTVKVRHHHDIPVTVYKEKWDHHGDARTLIGFEK